jgi:glycosyltransferase involved in cell wall biosynthesis
MRLLLIAPTCDGEDVGEAWSAHQWAKRLGAANDTTLLTYSKRGRMPASAQLPDVRVVEWTEPLLVGRSERLNSMLKPGYVPFYVRARRWIRDALARGELFDVVHQLTPLAMRYPSPAAGLGVPLVLGPVGGSLDDPPGFAGEGTSSPWYVSLRNLDGLRIRHDPWLRRTYEDARCVVGIGPYVRDFLAPCRLRRFEVMSDTGIEALPEIEPRPARTGPVRLLFVGRLVRTKGVRDALRALARLDDRTPFVFDVVGDGFDREACEALTQDLGLGDVVRFHGRVPRVDVDALYRDADVFLFPSYREPGGNAVLEAMSFGLPLVVADRGGPANVVDASCAIAVPAVDPEQFARDLATGLAPLLDDSGLRAQMGAAARRRVADVALWDRKATAMQALYDDVVVGGDPATTSAT